MSFLSSVLLALGALPAVFPAPVGGDARTDKRPVGLRPLDFPAALSTARVEKRCVLALFCDGEASCRTLSEDMLKEVKLRAWLDEKVVAIQVDKGAQLELSAKYRIRSTPTYLFVDAKGTELDRIVGARDSKALRAEGEEILKGGDPLERLQKRRKGRESDPEMRLRYADILCDRGELDAALVEYLAVHAQGGPMAGPAFEELLRLGRIYPKASEAIAGIAAAMEPRIQSADASDAEFERWFGLCRQLKLELRMLALHDALARFDGQAEVDAAHKERAAALRKRIAPALRDLFYTDQRYADLGGLIEDALADFGARKARHAELATAGDASATKTSLRLLREDTARDYETLAAVKRLGEATLLADALISFDTTVATYDALIEGAQRANAGSEAKMLASRGRSDARIDPKLRIAIGPTIPHQAK
ncbi:MAG: thioredoxin family protein [Planctomycetota bacterium]|nr:thioredoxin family protein [Planctomycetota bacterium]